MWKFWILHFGSNLAIGIQEKLSYDRFGHGIQQNTEYGIRNTEYCKRYTEYGTHNIVKGTLGGQQVAMAHLGRTQKSHVANLFV